jgi:two-component system sensor kinase FixL
VTDNEDATASQPHEAGTLARAILETVIDSIITVDKGGVIGSINGAAVSAFGYEEGELIGRNVSMLMPEPHAKEHDGYIARYLETGVGRIIGVGREVPCKRKDGSIFPGDLAVTRAIVGGETLFIGVIRDLSERKRAEKELQAAQRRVHAAEELAAVGTLVAGLAHEIGTPMGVIQGHARLLEKSIEGERASWRLKTIQEQISRISRIIQSLLNMARPKASERVLVNLEQLVETTLSFLQEKLERHRVEVVRELETTGSISGDPERLQQLLLNLCLNAVDAMPDGGELRIRLRPHGSAGACLRIGDTGTGIPAEDLPLIFDAFHTSKEAGKGNGLGLTVASRIVADHGGSIDVESEVERGTEFHIHLPWLSTYSGDQDPSN